jgi:hypothetical protein
MGEEDLDAGRAGSAEEEDPGALADGHRGIVGRSARPRPARSPVSGAMHLQAPGPLVAAGPSRFDGQGEGTQETETAMPDITLPEIHLPDVKLPDGLRDMSRQDIQSAISDRMPKKVEMPDVDLSKIDLSKIDLSKIDLPKAVEKRLPGRRRTNPILPIAAVLAIGSLFAAAWWLITSPTAMLRVRETTDRLRARLGMTGVDDLDAEDRLETLLPDANQTRPSLEAETWPDTFSDLGETVQAGNGSGEQPVGV